MDGQALPVSPHDLYARLGTASAPVLLDVRRSEAFGADNALIAGAIHRSPESVPLWIGDLPAGRSIVVYCVHGHEVSQGVAAALRTAGIPAAYLEEGIAGWKERRLPTRRKSEVPVERWVTREHPKIDRIACPWLVAALHQSRCRIHLRACERRAESRRGARRRSLRHQGR